MFEFLAISDSFFRGFLFFREGDRGVGGKEEKTRVCAKTHFGLGIEVSGKTASCAVPVEWSSDNGSEWTMVKSQNALGNNDILEF